MSNYQLLDIPTDEIECIADLPINQNCQTYSFHYAPYYTKCYRQRAVAIANWVATTDPIAVIVDVSAEISQYLRFLGVPVIAVRQHGDRSDFPHLCGYSAAYRLLAPFPRLLEAADTPNWIIDKTIYSPGFSRYSGINLDKQTARQRLDIEATQKVVVVLNGSGGGKHSLSKISAAAAATPQWLWLVIGAIKRDYHLLPDNISVLGWRKNTYIYLQAADVVIAHGGHNTVMEIGTAQKPFLCIPESRPFDEQKVKAEILENLGLCFSADAFPDANAIGFILDKLTQLDVSKWQPIMATDGAERTAKAIADLLRNLVTLNSTQFSKTIERDI